MANAAAFWQVGLGLGLHDGTFVRPPFNHAPIRSCSLVLTKLPTNNNNKFQKLELLGVFFSCRSYFVSWAGGVFRRQVYLLEIWSWGFFFFRLGCR